MGGRETPRSPHFRDGFRPRPLEGALGAQSRGSGPGPRGSEPPGNEPVPQRPLASRWLPRDVLRGASKEDSRTSAQLFCPPGGRSCRQCGRSRTCLIENSVCVGGGQISLCELGDPHHAPHFFFFFSSFFGQTWLCFLKKAESRGLCPAPCSPETGKVGMLGPEKGPFERQEGGPVPRTQ